MLSTLGPRDRDGFDELVDPSSQTTHAHTFSGAFAEVTGRSTSCSGWRLLGSRWAKRRWSITNQSYRTFVLVAQLGSAQALGPHGFNHAGHPSGIGTSSA